MIKIRLNTFLIAVSMACAAFAISGCKDDDNDPRLELTGESVTYPLQSVSNPDISGTVKFSERSDFSTIVTITLIGTASGNTHPAHIHANSAAETGGIIVDLNSLEGASGTSETVVTHFNDGTDVEYSELILLNGYVNVHLSPSNLATLIAQGDIGENELTATSTTYSLSELNDSGIMGTVKFTQRRSGSTLVSVDLDGTSQIGNHPITINDNNATTTGPTAITLNNFNGATGKSETTIRTMDNNTAITYDQLRTFNGHINVRNSAIDETIVSQGNIGAN